MDIRFLSSFLMLYITLTHALEGLEYEGPMCSTCLEASRKAQQTLSNVDLFGDAEMLSFEVCYSLPSTLKAQCLEKSLAHLHKSKCFLKDLFREKNICNSTGICNIESEVATRNAFTSLAFGTFDDEDEDGGSCPECRKAVKNIFTIVRAPRLRKKILEAILDQCEEELDTEKECRQIVNKFGAKILMNLDKLRPNEVCRMINLCDEGASL